MAELRNFRRQRTGVSLRSYFSEGLKLLEPPRDESEDGFYNSGTRDNVYIRVDAFCWYTVQCRDVMQVTVYKESFESGPYDANSEVQDSLTASMTYAGRLLCELEQNLDNCDIKFSFDLQSRKQTQGDLDLKIIKKNRPFESKLSRYKLEIILKSEIRNALVLTKALTRAKFYFDADTSACSSISGC